MHSLATLPLTSPFIPTPLYTRCFGVLRFACPETSWHGESKSMRCCFQPSQMHARAFSRDAKHKMAKRTFVSAKTRQQQSLKKADSSRNLFGTSIEANTSLGARRHGRGGGLAMDLTRTRTFGGGMNSPLPACGAGGVHSASGRIEEKSALQALAGQDARPGPIGAPWYTSPNLPFR